MLVFGWKIDGRKVQRVENAIISFCLILWFSLMQLSPSERGTGLGEPWFISFVSPVTVLSLGLWTKALTHWQQLSLTIATVICSAFLVHSPWSQASHLLNDSFMISLAAHRPWMHPTASRVKSKFLGLRFLDLAKTLNFWLWSQNGVGDKQENRYNQ